MSLNRFQAIFVGCTAFLLFVCVRSYSPYPEYRAPMTQVIKDEPFPDSKVSLDSILERRAHWSDSSRDSFRVHDTYVQKRIEKAAETVETVEPEIKETEKPPLPEEEKRVPHVPEVPLMKFTPKVEPGPEPIREVMDLLAVVDTIHVVRPKRPPAVRPSQRPKPPRTPGPKRTVPKKPTKTEHRKPIGKKPKQPAAGPSQPGVEPLKPYELPFRLQGIVKAEEDRGPMIILKDKESGKRVRRYEGQSFQGVRIRKIGPGSVEVEVPDEGLELRYMDTIHKWVAM